MTPPPPARTSESSAQIPMAAKAPIVPSNQPGARERGEPRASAVAIDVERVPGMMLLTNVAADAGYCLPSTDWANDVLLNFFA